MSILASNDLEHLARQRAVAKLGWLAHAAVYLAVNLGVAALAFAHGRDSAAPFLGWGLGLALHGMAVLLRTSDLPRWLEQRERRRLRAQHDPW